MLCDADAKGSDVDVDGFAETKDGRSNLPVCCSECTMIGYGA